MTKSRLVVGMAISVVHLLGMTASKAAGVSPYLPLSTSPAIERDFERVLILAGRPVMRRPIPAAVVLDALPEVCNIDVNLCARVRKYLERFQSDAGISRAQASLAASAGASDQVMPNAFGRTRQSTWALSGSAFYQPSDYLLLTGGGVAYQGGVTPTGSMVSAGVDFAQLDIGYREHWLSPMMGSSLLISTEAPTMPSVTLSNYRPISPFGLNYEVFTALMSKQSGIEYFNETTVGNPYLVGLQFGAAPFEGFAVSANKVMQFGGGARGGVSLPALRKAIFANKFSVNAPDGSNGQLEFGNQAAGVATTVEFPGKVPLAFSMEYAGEDYLYSNDGNYRLGDTAVSLKFDFPKLGERYDLNYEVSEWQNAWYTHHLYPAGLSNRGVYIGHWFAEEHLRGDGMGGHSHQLTLGYRDDNADYWQLGYRNLAFVSSVGYQRVPEFPYRHLNEITARYSGRRFGRDVSAELQLGQDALGSKYGRVAMTFEFSDVAKQALFEHSEIENGDSGVDWFVDAGISHSRVRVLNDVPDYPVYRSAGYHLAFGARRSVSDRQDLGARLEFDRVDGHGLFSVRAIDYRYRLFPHLALGLFGGVGRYNYGEAAFGWYGGIGAETVGMLGAWDVGFTWRYHDKLSRNRVLSSDPAPAPGLARMHFDVSSRALFVTRHF